jgi:uncharacterized protein YbbC (DUF1343 family)
MRRIPQLGLVFCLMALWTVSSRAQVRTGIDVLEEDGFRLLQGKRVGLVTNPTGVNSHLRSTVDLLHEHCDLRALFAPEHGVRGDRGAGDRVEDMVDPKTGVPVYSLYGSNRKPDPGTLKDLDVIVYDIQDIGVRSYTYISTLGMIMEAAAAAGTEVVVLDRPNPLGGEKVEGPPVEEGFRSFVSRYNIPYIYGLTCGELALMLNGEGMLESGVSCKLEVVPMKGWERTMSFRETGLQWVPTSPHVPHALTAFFYPATGIIGELDPGMIGIGYTLPFQVLVTPEIDADSLADAMNALDLEGVIFRPIYITPYYQSGKGIPLQGVQIHLTDPSVAPLTEIQFLFLQEARKLDPGFDPFRGREDRYRSVDIVCGSDRFRKALMEDFDFGKLREDWNRGAEKFQKRSEPYYLYVP